MVQAAVALLAWACLLQIPQTAGQVCIAHFDSSVSCSDFLTAAVSPAPTTCFSEGSCTRISGNTSAIFVRNGTSNVDVTVFNTSTCSGSPRSTALPSQACASGTLLNPSWSAVWSKCRVCACLLGVSCPLFQTSLPNALLLAMHLTVMCAAPTP